MKLKDYLDKNMIIHAKFAEKLNISPSHLCQITRGKHNICLDIAMKIEKTTQGKVTCKDLYEDWLLTQNIMGKKVKRNTE